MGNIKFTKREKIDIEILRCLLQLSVPWQSELDTIADNKRKEVISKALPLLEQIIKNANLTNEEIEIINETLINKHDSMERIGRKYFYSDSGLRNKVNLILKKLLEEID